MFRGEYERRVVDAIGPVVDAYGFVLAPQRPSDVDEASPVAYFELGIDEFTSAFPRLAQRMGLAVDHVDLTIQWMPPDSMIVDLEGFSLTELAELACVSTTSPTVSLDAALQQTAATLRAALPAFTEAGSE